MATATRRGILAAVTVAVLLLCSAAVGILLGEVNGRPVQIDPVDRVQPAAWAARTLLFLALAWVLIGIIATRTRLVRRPGAAAARATWLGSTRPWRARESTLGMLGLDRLLLVGVPGGLLLATLLVETALLSWTYVAVAVGAWLVFLIVLRVLIDHERSPYPVAAAIGGVVMFRCILSLLELSFAESENPALSAWSSPLARVAYVAVALALFAWTFVAAGWALSQQMGVRRATGAVLAAAGAGLGVTATILGAVGFEQALLAWHDELEPLPWVLSRVLGTLVTLDIPDALPWFAVGCGILLLVVGVSLLTARRRR